MIVDKVKGNPVYVRSIAEVTESGLPRLGQVGRDHDAVEAIFVMLDRRAKRADMMNTNRLTKIGRIKNVRERHNVFV